MSPLWTTDKAALVASYIHHFLFVTKHGVYLDLFAAPQDDEDDWCIRRVLEGRTRGPAISYFAACDIDAKGVKALKDLAQSSDAPFRVYHGDANERVHEMLDDAPIGERTPCFCLIDQRTFECNWSTVKTIAEYKQAGHKIELFYFLAERWLDRSVAALRHTSNLADWWGAPGVEDFLALRNVHRAQRMCERFKELGYRFVEPFSIHEHGRSSRTVYYMIFASDHEEAIQLMGRAYNRVPTTNEQGQLELPNISLRSGD